VTRDIFDNERLPAPVDEFLRDTNPWWEGKPGPVISSYRRWTFHTTLKRLESGLAPAEERRFLEGKLKAESPYDEVLVIGDSATPGVKSLDGLFKRFLEEEER
jgi:hypothetical protein